MLGALEAQCRETGTWPKTLPLAHLMAYEIQFRRRRFPTSDDIE